MLYTGKGDNGTTKTLNSQERIPKDNNIIKALGCLDELNAWAGYCRASAIKQEEFVKAHIPEIVLTVQENLFNIQGIIAGAQLSFNQDKIDYLEEIINQTEKQLPPIKSFLIPGETLIGAMFDVARTITRRAERSIISANNDNKIDPIIIAYLNRLSSLFYALARLSALLEKALEKSPSYK